jgi:radical SAM protein with 4Fe4S-binding SPASM domain
LLTPQIARNLVKSGVVNFSISLDGSTQENHEKIRGVPGCFNKTIEGIQSASSAGVCVQVNFTAMKQNLSELLPVIELAESLRIDLFMVFQSIPPYQKRGAVELGTGDQLHLMETIREKQKKSSFLIMPVCSPEYWPLIAGQNRKNLIQKWLLRSAFTGCGAGRGFCYVRFDGDVWPCNFIPVAAGNVRRTSLDKIWRESPLLAQFRKPQRALKDECCNCTYNPICGGCRGRAFAHCNDYLATDPNCTIINRDNNRSNSQLARS